MLDQGRRIVAPRQQAEDRNSGGRRQKWTASFVRDIKLQPDMDDWDK